MKTRLSAIELISQGSDKKQFILFFKQCPISPQFVDITGFPVAKYSPSLVGNPPEVYFCGVVIRHSASNNICGILSDLYGPFNNATSSKLLSSINLVISFLFIRFLKSPIIQSLYEEIPMIFL